MRRIAGLLAAALCLPGVLALTGPGRQGESSSCGTTTSGAPAVTPPFAAATTIVDLVADPDLAGRLWVTDGATIRRSDDRGCTWTDTFSLDVTIATTGNRIVDLASPSGDPDWVSGLVFEPNPAIPGQVALTVVTTRDAGASWIVIDEGLPDNVTSEVPEACHRTCGMVGTTDGDEAIYLWFTEPSGVSVYWSVSGGRIFSARSTPASPLSLDVRTEQPADELVMDDPGYFGLFGTRSQEGATASDDGGRTWNAWPEHFEDFPEATFGFPDEAIGQAADRAVDRLLVAELDDAGRLTATHAKFADVLGWHRAATDDVPGTVTGLTSLGDASILAVTTSEGVWVGEQVTLAEVVWRPLRKGTALQSVQFADGLVWAHDGRTIVALDPDVLPRLLDLPPIPVPPAELDLPPFDPANPIGPLPGTLRGPAAGVHLGVGETLDVPLTLDVPPTNPAVDLFFLVARHDSMQDDLDTLTREFFFVIKDLVARGVDVNVGIGVYGSQVRYHRYRDIGPANDEFKKVVDDIYGYGAVGATYTALDASLVGTIYPDTATKFGTFKGIETHWRPNTTRIMVHVTDAEPRTDDELAGEEGATIEQAHAALVATGVLHLGLVSGDAGVVPTSRPSARMQDLSRVSGAIAVNPIDCNGDGIIDVPVGDPIVCFVPAGGTNEAVADLGLLAGFGDVIVDLLGQATLRLPLSLHTTTPDLVTAFRPTTPTASINLLAQTTVPTIATIRCLPAYVGTVLTTRLSAASGTRGLATTTLDVRCGDLPVTPRVPDAPVVQPGVEPVTVEVLAPAPVPVVPAAAPVPVANAPASTNVFPNQGMASVEQREEQRQAATIGKDAPQQDPEAEFAFSAVRPRQTSPATTLVLGAAMTAGAVGALARRRQEAARPAASWITTSRNSRG